MSFVRGQIIVHPFHGPVRVLAVAPRAIDGDERDYFELETLGAGMRVSVPVSQAAVVGLRELMNREQVGSLLGVLRQPSPPQPTQWLRRTKAWREMLQHGNITSRAIVLRDVVRSGKVRSGSEEHRLMLAARTPLIDEIHLALGISESRAEGVVAAAIDHVATAVAA